MERKLGRACGGPRCRLRGRPRRTTTRKRLSAPTHWALAGLRLPFRPNQLPEPILQRRPRRCPASLWRGGSTTTGDEAGSPSDAGRAEAGQSARQGNSHAAGAPVWHQPPGDHRSRGRQGQLLLVVRCGSGAHGRESGCASDPRRRGHSWGRLRHGRWRGGGGPQGQKPTRRTRSRVAQPTCRPSGNLSPAPRRFSANRRGCCKQVMTWWWWDGGVCVCLRVCVCVCVCVCAVIGR
mmetsp:Transcript_18435/g.34791  ORF Transcript_18435/g.34791 Transcript_18435/m.34791 type:complete len:236 (-) Transcript_18435:278-985(-)